MASQKNDLLPCAGAAASDFLPDTPSDEVSWGIEHSCNTLWIGPMRPDGEKVDQVIVSLACGPDFTHNQQVQQHQYANLIAAAPLLAEAAELAFVTLRPWQDSEFVWVTMKLLKAALAQSRGEEVTPVEVRAFRNKWNKSSLADAYEQVESVRRDAAQNPDSPLDASLRAALDAIEAADCEWDGLIGQVQA